MVEGLARFASHFSGFTDQYVLIGGAACDLVMVPRTIVREMATFAASMATEKIDLKSLGLADVTQDEMLAQFQGLYGS